MKKLLCLILISSFAMSGPVFADAVKVHEWKLDGNLDDTSGSGNNGTMEGNPQYVQGLVGQCLEFDSSDDHIRDTSASNIPTTSTDAWSINMYLYGDAAPDWAALGGFGDWGTSVNGEARYLIHGGEFQFWGYYVDIYFGPSWTAGEWQMATITFSGGASGTMKFYLNGQEKHSETVSTLTDAAAEVYLAPPLWDNLFAGRIDEFTIWDGVLTEEQITELTLALGPAKKAWHPDPVDGAPIRTGYRAVDPAVVISWSAPLNVNGPTYNVYFGTDPNDMALVSENQAETSYDPCGTGELNEGTVYYWRIDVKDPNEGNPVIHTGDTWSFTTWESSAAKVLEWKMDADNGTVAEDSTSNGNNGTLVGDPQWVKGMMGNCLEFDGDGDAVEIIDANNLPISRTDAWSINMYLYSWWLQTNKVIAGFGDPNCDWGEARYLMNANDERFQFWGRDIDIYAEAVSDIEKWQMLTITYEGSDVNDWGELRIYKNGIEKGYSWVNFWEHDALAKAYLSPGVWGNYYSGKIDEFTIWDGALTPTQIAELTDALPPQGDLDGDADVDFCDFAILAKSWLKGI